MRVVVCHSSHERCGVRQYGAQLDRSLQSLTEVSAFHFGDLPALTRALRPGDVVLIHYEPGLIQGDLKSTLKTIRSNGCKIAFCCHWFGDRTVAEYGALVDRFILHRSYPTSSDKAVEIALGCPVYEPPNRDVLRNQFGFNGKIAVTTVGFLTAWKKLPDVAQTLARIIDLPNAVIRVQAPHPFSPGSGSQGEERRFRQVVANHRGRVVFSTDFLPENDLLNLVHASDLGFVFHGIHTGSVSAATKQFVSARTPVVVTDSSHAADIEQGVLRVPGFNIDHFCREIVRLLRDEGARTKMRADIAAEYERINMGAVAKRYVEELGRL